MDPTQVAKVLRACCVTSLSGSFGVDLNHVLGALRVGLKVDVGVASFGSPDEGLRTAQSWYPNWGMGFLQGHLERVNHPEVVVLALPAEGARGGPSLDYQVMRFFESFPVVEGVDVRGQAFHAGATDEARHHSTVGDHVYF